MRYFAQLACSNTPNTESISFESQLSSDFHTIYRRDEAVQVARVARPYKNSISNPVLISVGDKKELWTVFSGDTQRSESSLLISSVTENFSNADFRNSQQDIKIPNLKSIAVAPNQEYVWAVADSELIRIDVATKEQVSFNIVDDQTCNGASEGLQVLDSEWVAVAADNETIFTNSLYKEGVLVNYLMRQWRVSSSTAAPECISQARLGEVLGDRAFPTSYQLASSTETSTTMYILSEDPFIQNRLFKMDFFHDGRKPEFTQLSGDNILDFHVFPQEERIGFIVGDIRSYQEMTFDGEYLTGTQSAFPWLRSPTSLAYDPEKDRVFVVGYDFCEVTDRPENDPCRNPNAVGDQTIRVMAAGIIDRTRRKTSPSKYVFRDFEKGDILNLSARVEYTSFAERMLVFDTTQAYLYIVPTE